MFVNPMIDIPVGASDIHGITNEFVADAPVFEVVAAKFLPYLSGHNNDGVPPILCGYNAVSYDAPLLNNELARVGASHKVDPTTVLDPIVFIRWFHRDWLKKTLSVVAKRFGFSLENAHSAAADAEATGHILAGLIRSGVIPDDIDDALALQKELIGKLDYERELYKHSIYFDRDGGTGSVLRLGFGKHIGVDLKHVDPSYLQYCLDNFSGLTDETIAQFKTAIG